MQPAPRTLRRSKEATLKKCRETAQMWKKATQPSEISANCGSSLGCGSFPTSSSTSTWRSIRPKTRCRSLLKRRRFACLGPTELSSTGRATFAGRRPSRGSGCSLAGGRRVHGRKPLASRGACGRPLYGTVRLEPVLLYMPYSSLPKAHGLQSISMVGRTIFRMDIGFYTGAIFWPYSTPYVGSMSFGLAR